MTVRRQFATALALAALLLGAGCGKPDTTALVPEAEDSLYLQGKQLVRQGRNPEALSTFLKAIEKRGVQESAESHLEAGLIYLEHIKDFPEAIHHFRKFLELQPNSKDAVRVRGLVDTAKRAFARTLPARPDENQSVRLELREETERLKRENEELRAEVATLRGGAAAQVLRSSRGPLIVDQPKSRTAAPTGTDPLITLAPQPPSPATVEVTPAQPAPTPTRSTKAPASAGRRHTVVKGDTLYSLAQQYYGDRSKWRQIFDANRDVMPSQNALSLGMELKIP